MSSLIPGPESHDEDGRDSIEKGIAEAVRSMAVISY